MTGLGVTMNAVEFRRMLRASLVAAAKNGEIRCIAAVLLHVDNDRGVLVATASDRYLLSQISAPCVGGLTEPVLVERDDVRTIVAAAKPVRGNATLTVMDGRVTVVFDGGATVTFAASEAEFPRNIGTLLPAKPLSTDRVALTAWMLKRIAKVSERMHSGISRISLHGERDAVVVYVGDSCRLLAMPVAPSATADAPSSDPFAAVASGGGGEQP